MTEHLPECWNTVVSDPTVSCICDELRDCEARVLDAVQAAVHAVTHELTVSGPIMIRRADILAAIDALSEQVKR